MEKVSVKKLASYSHLSHLFIYCDCFRKTSSVSPNPRLYKRKKQVKIVANSSTLAYEIEH